MKLYLLLDSYKGDTTYYVIKAESEQDAKDIHRKSCYGENTYYYNLSYIDVRELKEDIEEVCTTEH
jgi:hypothetical protein